MSLEEQIQEIGRKARAASRRLATLPAATKNAVLEGMATELRLRSAALITENEKDLAGAEAKGLNPAALDRLRLTEKRIAQMADGICQVAQLDDPVGQILSERTRPNGLRIQKLRTPIGVIGIIYESRPNVTSDAAVLCIKTGNAVVLRGGSESLHSNIAIAEALQAGGSAHGLPDDAVQLIPTKDREAVKLMARMDKYIDVIIPRGGHALIEAVVENARMPVIKHYHGVCQIYVDRAANLDMATEIIINAKCQRPGVCNAAETLIVHRDIAEKFLKQAGPALVERGVELRGDPATRAILNGATKEAVEEDWATEYLDLILAVCVVDDFEQAVEHIEKYGSHHSDAIITEDRAAAERFLSEVDSATVYWNASTRFTDGGEFGFGAEIGISTDKLHARGPMGLEELTSYKYIIRGHGQVRP